MTHRMASLHLDPVSQTGRDRKPLARQQKASTRAGSVSTPLRALGHPEVAALGATRLDERTAKGDCPAGSRGRGQRNRRRRAERARPRRPQLPPARLLTCPPARASAKQGARSPGARLPDTSLAAVADTPPEDADPARNSRENTPEPARTFVGDTGEERKFRRAQRAGATRSPSPPRASAVSAQARGRSLSCWSAPRPRTSAAVGSYVTPGPPEAEGGTARTGAPWTRRPPVWLP